MIKLPSTTTEGHWNDGRSHDLNIIMGEIGGNLRDGGGIGWEKHSVIFFISLGMVHYCSLNLSQW